ncbi:MULTISPECIES: hypothetical protein [unclassified Pasteurella]|uniref:hypothetical protein n=1 Tax=unclassified Pasteurella TaxID=2621516 RepID=UPI001073EFD6|nr:hypothetical protein [Pasteurella sp. 19428wF3_WM03]TFU49797.1 hypothetical protein E4T92_10105 [Pasteurella sp. WM03]
MSILDRIKDFFCNKEFVSTLSTGIICAFISWGITSCIEEKNREINLRPYLDIGPSRVSYKDDYFGLVIRNTGKGPAIITGGYIKAKSKIYFKDINSNILDILLPELQIYSETFNTIWDGNSEFRESSKEINKNNSCRLFFSFDYIPTTESSIKDGEDLALISFPTQYTNSEIGKKYPNNEIYQKIYNECRHSFENMIKNGNFSIELKYISLNKDKYEMKEKRIKF